MTFGTRSNTHAARSVSEGEKRGDISYRSGSRLRVLEREVGKGRIADLRCECKSTLSETWKRQLWFQPLRPAMLHEVRRDLPPFTGSLGIRA